jgi:hypothetical protein
MATPFLLSRTLRAAAKRRHASSSVARYASMLDGHGHLVAPDTSMLACFSPAQSTIYSEGDR